MCPLQGTGQLPSVYWLGIQYDESTQMWFFEDECEWAFDLAGLSCHSPLSLSRCTGTCSHKACFCEL